MDAKRKPFENEVPKHKKKSKKKGQPRADHKHDYKEVVVHSWWDNPFKQGEKREHTDICEVCTICGRIGKYITGIFDDWDKNEYDVDQMEHWYKDDWMDKAAKKLEELNNEEE
jgi:hypothetical protein